MLKCTHSFPHVWLTCMYVRVGSCWNTFPRIYAVHHTFAKSIFQGWNLNMVKGRFATSALYRRSSSKCSKFTISVAWNRSVRSSAAVTINQHRVVYGTLNTLCQYFGGMWKQNDFHEEQCSHISKGAGWYTTFFKLFKLYLIFLKLVDENWCFILYRIINYKVASFYRYRHRFHVNFCVMISKENIDVLIIHLISAKNIRLSDLLHELNLASCRFFICLHNAVPRTIKRIHIWLQQHRKRKRGICVMYACGYTEEDRYGAGEDGADRSSHTQKRHCDSFTAIHIRLTFSKRGVPFLIVCAIVYIWSAVLN